jgi:F0F1-type ATP synthase assembly protein I
MFDKDVASKKLGKSLRAYRRRSRMLASLITFILVGALLSCFYLDRFVFLYSEEYFDLALWTTLISAPLVLYRLKKSSEIKRQATSGRSAVWLRDWIALPLVSALLVGMIFCAPIGWVAAFVAWSNVGADQVGATALLVEGYVRGKGCNQYAKLKFDLTVKDVCLDGIYPPSTMRAGQLLDVGVSKFRYGFYIRAIDQKEE